MFGAGILGKNAGELIDEAALAVEMDDVVMTVHPHPALSETLNFVTEGTRADIYTQEKVVPKVIIPEELNSIEVFPEKVVRKKREISPL